MRVLFTAYGAYGHILSLTSVARALAGDGHDVLIATAPDMRSVVSSQGIEAVDAGLTDEAAVGEAHRRWPETRFGPLSAWIIQMFCQVAAPVMAADLRPILDRWRPDVVVREEGEHGGPLAAAAAGVPWVTHGWGCPLPDAAFLATLNRLLAPAWEAAGLAPPTGTATYGAAVLDPCPPSLYAARPRLPHRYVVAPYDAQPAPAAGNNPSRAYVGFGTVPLFRDAGDLTGAVVGALVDHGLEVTVTSGDDGADELRGIDPGRVRVERWVDLAGLFRTCDLVVCHGGAGTVLAALAAGLPLLLLPRGAPSQLRMATACEGRGVGRALTWIGTNTGELRDAVAEVASSEGMRAAARAVADEMAAMPHPSTVTGVLQAVVSGAGEPGLGR